MIYNILKDKSEFMEKTMMNKKTQKKGLKIQYNTKKSVIYLIIAIPTIVFTIWNLFCGSIQIRCNDRDFNIEAKGWNDYTGSIRKLIAFLMKKMYCRTIMITELMVLEN